jgi:hypothetical protein
MLFNFDLLIIILAIIIFGGLSAYTLYIIFPTLFKSSNKGFFNRFKSALVKLSFTGIISTEVISDSIENSTDNSTENSTSVGLTDEELNELLQVVFREIGESHEISAALLQSLGLYTETVVRYLEAMGYIIF